jgi:subtilisin family serine protease
MKKVYLFAMVLGIVLLIFTGCTTLDLNNDSSNSSLNSSSSQLDAEAILGDVINKINSYDYYENELIVGYSDDESFEKLKDYLKASEVKVVEFEGNKKAALIKINTTVENALLKLKDYRNFDGIRYIEPSLERELPDYEISGEKLNSKYNPTDALTGLADPPNPYWAEQWGLQKVGASEAWQEATGEDVVVAIIDGGVDSTHPDFLNSFVDGYNPVTADVIPAGQSIAYDPHGTHVAGIVAANRDDHFGVAGLAPDALIMPIPIFQPGYIGDIYVADGVKWAVDHGAKILQNSWGGPGFSNILKDAFDYALKNDVLVVVSTGNTHIDENWGFPNTIPGIIGVGSTNVNDDISIFSSRGDSVSVVAPGEKILSTVPGGWEYYQGTSMASPFVSGLAALLLQKYPDATPYQIRKMIENSAVDVDGIDDFSTNDGYGRIDAEEALKQPLPEEKGANFVIFFTDSNYLYNIPNVYVSLKREDGPSYYGRSVYNGEAGFYQVDPDVYDIYIGGPDYLDPYSPNLRMEEQLFYEYLNYEIQDGEQVVIENLESEFSATFEEPSGEGEFSITILDANSGEYVTIPLKDELTIAKPDFLQFYIVADVTTPLSFPGPIFVENFDTGIPNDWILDGDIPPYVEDGVVVLGGPNLEDDEFSSLTGIFDLPDATYGYNLNFDLKVSSEEGWDYFYLYIDGNLKYSDSGETGWYTVSLPISDGVHEITFEYVKDGSVSVGDDTAYIDNVEIVPMPEDYMDYAITGTININGNAIEIVHSLYDGNIIDGIEGIDAWFTTF